MEFLLTQRDAALTLRLSERTLERLRSTGAGPQFVKANSAGSLPRSRSGIVDRLSRRWLNL